MVPPLLPRPSPLTSLRFLPSSSGMLYTSATSRPLPGDPFTEGMIVTPPRRAVGRVEDVLLFVLHPLAVLSEASRVPGYTEPDIGGELRPEGGMLASILLMTLRTLCRCSVSLGALMSGSSLHLTALTKLK